MITFKSLLSGLLVAGLFAGCEPNSSTSGFDRSSEVEGGGGEKECAFTQGYWKNHPEAWPVDQLTLGGVQYSKQELLAIFNEPVRGNGLISLAHQLIAAKLNIANGADASSLTLELGGCDGLIGNLQVPPIGSGYLSTSATSALVAELDEFNNSGECKKEPVCGNGAKEEGEECDDGNTVDNDYCSKTCKSPKCGDGAKAGDEECDDGNTVDNDYCSNTCKAPKCGDGIKGEGEECDDGNTVDNDYCSNTCKAPKCGDGIKGEGEECDDGNTVDADYCSNTCKAPKCGDGVKAGGEECDDGNTVDTDACSNTCKVCPSVIL